MSEEHLGRHLGYGTGTSEATYPGWRILNHESWLPKTFSTLGTITADRMAEKRMRDVGRLRSVYLP